MIHTIWPSSDEAFVTLRAAHLALQPQPAQPSSGDAGLSWDDIHPQQLAFAPSAFQAVLNSAVLFDRTWPQMVSLLHLCPHGRL